MVSFFVNVKMLWKKWMLSFCVHEHWRHNGKVSSFKTCVIIPEIKIVLHLKVILIWFVDRFYLIYGLHRKCQICAFHLTGINVFPYGRLPFKDIFERRSE